MGRYGQKQNKNLLLNLNLPAHKVYSPKCPNSKHRYTKLILN